MPLLTTICDCNLTKHWRISRSSRGFPMSGANSKATARTEEVHKRLAANERSKVANENTSGIDYRLARAVSSRDRKYESYSRRSRSILIHRNVAARSGVEIMGNNYFCKKYSVVWRNGIPKDQEDTVDPLVENNQDGGRLKRSFWFRNTTLVFRSTRIKEMLWLSMIMVGL